MNKTGYLVLIGIVFLILLCWFTSYFLVREQIDRHSYKLSYETLDNTLIKSIHKPIRFLDRLFFQEEVFYGGYYIGKEELYGKLQK